MTRAVLTARDDRGALLRQVVIDDGSAAIYDSAGSTSGGATIGYQRAPQFWLSGQGRGFVATPALQAARGVLLAMQHDTQARLLPEQRLGGHDVFVLASTSPAPPGFNPQVREEQRLYIDAQSYQVRGYDAVALQRNVPPHTLYSVRVPLDEQLARGEVPPDTYRFSPPPDAQNTGAICNGPPVATAAAAYGGVTPLLPAGTGGMRLQDLFSLQSPVDAAATTTYLYQPSASSSQALLVIVRHGGTVDTSTDGTVIVPSLATTVAGMRVRGTLVRTLPAFDEYTFSYAIGDTTVAIKGTNLSLPKFMHILGALVDGRGAAALQIRLQHDLSAAAHSGC